MVLGIFLGTCCGPHLYGTISNTEELDQAVQEKGGRTRRSTGSAGKRACLPVNFMLAKSRDEE